MQLPTLDKLHVKGKRVLVRLDLNVPLQNGQVSDETRIIQALPTLHELLSKGAQLILLSHLGRPKGKIVENLSLRPVVNILSKYLQKDVELISSHWYDEIRKQEVKIDNEEDKVLLLDNLRFAQGEEGNNPDFAQKLAQLGDIYVNDAFSVSHRAHASTQGITNFLPSFAGRALEKELKALSQVLEKPQRPLLAIIGGAKVSTKFDVLVNLAKQVDYLVIGGGMANTFLAAQGVSIGKSLYEQECVETAKKLLKDADAQNCEIILPIDGTLSREFKENAEYRISKLNDVANDEMILDVGPKTVEKIKEKLEKAQTIIWNGPLGAFETPPFERSTLAIAQFLASQPNKLTVAGGGDTIAALNLAKCSDKMSYVSTAGGAFLEWLEGRTLPGVASLCNQTK